MANYARNLLDELLGPNRNNADNLGFRAPEVCKLFLAKFCPYQLLSNTHSDVGMCPYRNHEEYMRKDYLNNGADYKAEYEYELFVFLKRVIADVDMKIRRGRNRLEKSTEEIEGRNPYKDENDEKIVLYETQINDYLKKIEEYGERGMIDEAQQLSMEVDKLTSEIQTLKSYEVSNPLLTMENAMEVCDICGALLVTSMTDYSRMKLDAHLQGKQHKGMILVRQTVKELEMKFPNGKPTKGLGPIERGFERKEPREREFRGERDFKERDFKERDFKERDFRDRSRRGGDFRRNERPRERSRERSRDRRDYRDHDGRRDSRDSRDSRRESFDSRRDSRDSSRFDSRRPRR